jgi:3-(3-hydroxy-phenyl)propionate hydroxylase
VLAGGKPGWLLRQLPGEFTVAVFAAGGEVPTELADALRFLGSLPIAVRTVFVTRAGQPADQACAWLRDADGLAFSRYAPEGEALYLFRPDQHVAARRRGLSATWLGTALRRACLTDVAFDAGIC